MAEVTFQCNGKNGRCGKKFTAGDWECFPGMKHEVEGKTYYMADAPHCDFKLDPDGLAFRTSRTALHVIPERILRDENGQMRPIGHPPAVFVMGAYSTGDPEYQFYLEHGTARQSTCSYEKWFDVYHTPKQKQNIKDGELRTRERELTSKIMDLERREREHNELLAKVKKVSAAEAR